MWYEVFRDNNKMKVEVILSENAQKQLSFVRKEVGFLH